MYEASDAGYELWNEARAEVLTGKTVDLSAEIAHLTSGAAHTFRAVDLVLEAWRTGGSAFLQGSEVWTAQVAQTLLAALPATTTAGPAIAGLDDLHVRILASEALVAWWRRSAT